MNLDLKKLKIAQAKACISVNEIVEKTGLGRATVSKILNGVNAPSAKSAGLIARALNIDIAELIINEK
ncbi:MAG: helix-turn-helix transcriptional regulator [Clostridium sp.]|uniref:helix-turn-helix domain-containing protein n=1 Tax=Clostridium sp. TaxID=1506 RepID=UPI002903BDEF|nr:helix-turn-helix transcriptional regulator [Clostridium sp.]MDU1602809.1 helix-turn-helix transcriptional regulator [Clostridium sp.]